MRKIAALFLAALAACSSGSNNGACTAQNCELLTSCGHAVTGADVCSTLPGYSDFIADGGFDQLCVQSCAAANQSDLFQCAADNFSTLTCQEMAADAGSGATAAAVDATCETTICTSRCQQCRASCSTAYVNCNRGCPYLGDLSTCTACSIECWAQLSACESPCYR